MLPSAVEWPSDAAWGLPGETSAKDSEVWAANCTPHMMPSKNDYYSMLPADCTLIGQAAWMRCSARGCNGLNGWHSLIHAFTDVAFEVVRCPHLPDGVERLQAYTDALLADFVQR